MYAILGATGQVGGNVLKSLLQLQPQVSVRVIGRRPPQAMPPQVQWHQADLADDPQALAAALEGVSAAFVLNPVPVDAADVRRDAARMSETIAEAIVRAGRPRIVALSSQGAHLREGTGVIATLHDFETALRQTGAALTCVRSTFFMESWLPFAAAALETGDWLAMRNPPDARDDAVSARDVGAIAAQCLLDAQAPAVVNVTGSRAYSEDDAAATLATLTGRALKNIVGPSAERAGVLEAAGLGRSYAVELAAMYAALDAGRVPFEAVADVRRGTTSLEDVFRDAFARAGA